MRRIGVLMPLAADDPEAPARVTAFAQGLQQLGWTDGRNVRIDYRWPAGDGDRVRKQAAELVALAPDVMVAASTLNVRAVQQAAPAVPLVFVQRHRPGWRRRGRKHGTAGWQRYRVYSVRVRD